MKLLTKRTKLNLLIILVSSGLSLPAFSAGDVDFGTNGTNAPSGSNSNGGNGGNSSATTSTVNTDQANSSFSNGGDGGSSDGIATTGGDGGDSEAVSLIEHTSGNVSANAFGNGGVGGAGDTEDDTIGGKGGDAGSFTSAKNTTGRVETLSSAVAGKGGDGFLGGDGGDAATAAAGENTGPGAVTVEALARGGNGGDGVSTGGNGGEAQILLTVTGTSTGGGDVNVKATQVGGDGGLGNGVAIGEGRGSGANSFLTDKVRGSTSGTLTLEQRALAGDSGRSAGGAAASSSLTTTNPGGGNLVGTSFSEGGDFGSANSQISLTGEKDVTATAEAKGGIDGKGIVAAFGESTGGGRVEVTGRATHGDGFSTEPGINANGSNGEDINLNNRVTGVTSGELVLRQDATAGNGGSLITHPLQPGESDLSYGNLGPGRGGDATSILTKTTNNSQSLEVTSIANAGSGGEGLSQLADQGGTRHDGANGGSGTANSNATNSTGISIATAIAKGGVGGSTDLIIRSNGQGPSLPELSKGGDGGNATANAVAASFGNNNQVEAYSDAKGGAVGNTILTGGVPGLQAGNAISEAQAVAHGNSNVIAEAQASGGIIGNGLSHVSRSFAGDATSLANGTSQGGDVAVVSTALGGRSVSTDTIRENGGNATATAIGQSTTGKVDALARATGGGAKEVGGSAMATSNAMSQNITRLETKAESHRSELRFNSGAQAETFSSVGGDVRTKPLGDEANSFAHAVAVPKTTDVMNTFSGNTNVPNAFDLGIAGNDVFLLGSMGAEKTVQTNRPDLLNSWKSSIDVGIDMDSLISGQELFVGLLNPESTGTGIFERLIFEIAVEGTIFESSQFITAAGADVFFDDQVINLGLWESFSSISSDNILDLMITFEMRTEDFNGYNFDLVVGTVNAVPLPAAVWFLISGLAALLGFSRKKTIH